ncbi:hypothetical protein [Mesorhizobium sp. M0870]|uniref:hypothetical protein n=1 Tax=Mesorhizobium sp. M0870 TaxID=2957016 RepID=UPI003334CE1D
MLALELAGRSSAGGLPSLDLDDPVVRSMAGRITTSSRWMMLHARGVSEADIVSILEDNPRLFKRSRIRRAEDCPIGAPHPSL